MDEKIVLDIINSVSAELWWTFAKLFVAAVVIMSLKNIVTSIAGMLRFAYSKKLGVGVHVKVNGGDGVISNYNWKWITIRKQGGDEMLVPMEKWQTLTWVIKDYYKEIYKEGEDEQS